MKYFFIARCRLRLLLEKKIVVFALLLFLSCQAGAQIRFSSSNTVGLIAGVSKPALDLQTVNGFKTDKLFLGVGVGKDDYYYRSIPLFADGRVFFSRDRQAFLYGDLGYNFVLKNKPKDDPAEVYTFSGGLYTGFGIGLERKLLHKSRVTFSLGHSLKATHLKQYYMVCRTCPLSDYDFRYKFNRIVLRAGIAF